MASFPDRAVAGGSAPGRGAAPVDRPWLLCPRPQSAQRQQSRSRGLKGVSPIQWRPLRTAGSRTLYCRRHCQYRRRAPSGHSRWQCETCTGPLPRGRGLARQTAVHNSLWDIAEHYTPETRCADYTQAMMDLGATAVHPQLPPVSTAHWQGLSGPAEGDQRDYPGKKPRKILPVKATTS